LVKWKVYGSVRLLVLLVLALNINSAFANTTSATFTRPSPAYKMDGTQVSPDAPRYENGEFRQAVMVEEGTTNILLYSQKFDNTPWVRGQFPTITADSDIGPDGTYTAYTIQDSHDFLYDYVFQNTTIPNDSTCWTGLIYVKKDNVTTRVFGLQMIFSGGTSSVNTTVALNTSTGEAAINIGMGSYKVDDIGEYWRLSLTVANNSTGNTNAHSDFKT